MTTAIIVIRFELQGKCMPRLIAAVSDLHTCLMHRLSTCFKSSNIGIVDVGEQDYPPGHGS
jgi:hypothetical protein